ncbi:hypothetical protein BDP55DRAFT_668923 [Colletotrichum godetiae]|uniref:Uncharacterized protein n=1 Tax=Colletotrichum godetiae TaxID=1209918 RepID=A0AAJ0AJQ4_9PEZI|nr:uncharacterized protein BDP55DRAFT_668923 [Colletotrichum godetiae]KAK1673693.1 hypothetical protein BDP55DRAFT_668923 [Colletotrichum godetiae]
MIHLLTPSPDVLALTHCSSLTNTHLNLSPPVSSHHPDALRQPYHQLTAHQPLVSTFHLELTVTSNPGAALHHTDPLSCLQPEAVSTTPTHHSSTSFDDPGT